LSIAQQAWQAVVPGRLSLYIVHYPVLFRPARLDRAKVVPLDNRCFDENINRYIPVCDKKYNEGGGEESVSDNSHPTIKHLHVFYTPISVILRKGLSLPVLFPIYTATMINDDILI
jgi:hypothetical protein